MTGCGCTIHTDRGEDCPNEARICLPCERECWGLIPDLDVDRLARALRAWDKRTADPETDRFTYSEGEDPIYDRLLMQEVEFIAAAYREDADAPPRG